MRTSTFKSIVSILLCMALVMSVCVGALAYNSYDDTFNIGETDPADYGDDDFFGELDYIPGDLNGDGVVTDQDAVYLLFHTFFESEYPVNQPVDFNGDGVVNDQDAVYLLFHTFFASEYPLN